jgi:hypothetical protein
VIFWGARALRYAAVQGPRDRIGRRGGRTCRPALSVMCDAVHITEPYNERPRPLALLPTPHASSGSKTSS